MKKQWRRLSVGLAAGVLLLSGSALAQNKPAGQERPVSECSKAGVAEKIEGQVAKVDPDQGKITVRGPKGENYEFQAPKETLQNYKVGDHIEARLRPDSNCKSTG